ncbi:MAG: 30S ribosomal protein S1 [Microgenomates group bacterium GW2011_GWC1_41_8]|uniref:30S ribosomal protein S1 n=2 Tax=Patescibacteria group TaxID=1783273 RepID=A0A0G1M8E6_9BACT|nr:MAG: 30S ribosomal protein S1 [Candidatus Roizmanbacteria bacterium GW2011_GWA1_41_13]KKS23273.1 MAG: 30S ribosomal protein S1 [Microgenomates group bacterium GW2011_GWC1_41_8]KKU04574.1 MAG: 30S ribosomal protein S1 [Candidatus Giovannonibacteria bacterium GW2011_GWA2_45_21]
MAEKYKDPKTQRSKDPNKQSKTPTPQTMEDLLAEQDIKLTSLSRGTLLKAKILKVGKREVLADIGAKSYGIIVGREFEIIAPLKNAITVGDTYDAEVIIPEMEGGETLISLKRTLIDSLWGELQKYAQNKSEVSVLASRPISGGLLVEYKSLRGFIPQMQLDPEFQDSPDRLVGQNIVVQVLEVDQRQNRLVMSQKEVTQKEVLAQQRSALTQFKIGDIVSGAIASVDRYSLMVSVTKIKGSPKKLEPVRGTIHISEISWERVDNLEEQFKKGDKIEAKVAQTNEQEGQLVLSLKQLTPDPWEDIKKKYPEEKQISGKVVKVSNIGAFVEIEKGIEGLIHVSKIPAGKEFTEGEKVSVIIDTLDTEKRKISLAYVPTTKPIGYR